MNIMDTAQRRTRDAPLSALAVLLPAGVGTLHGFRTWAQSKAFPEHGKISFFQGEILVDMSPERLESHGLVKGEISRVLSGLARETKSGIFLPDGTLVSNYEAGLSTEPDGTFIKESTVRSGGVRLIKTDTEPRDTIEVEGSPDWVMEVVSPSSVAKDRKRLKKDYHRAGVTEYWIVDARGDEIVFTILVRHAKRFLSAEKRKGWQKSVVFDRWFRLTRQRGVLDMWEYKLEDRGKIT